MPEDKRRFATTLAAWMHAMAVDDPNDAPSLVAAIEGEIAATAAYTGRSALSAPVRAALLNVPRENFVPHDEQGFAYLNCPLPIGHGQTISQPFIVAIMTELLDLQPGDAVLEIGTGCGYQTAILAAIARQVHSVEVIAELADAARERLAALGYRNIAIKTGNGALGWPEHAPFDAIIVTAAAAGIPPALVAQLKPGGRLVIPVGRPREAQDLVRLDKSRDGTTATRDVLPVAFVPLV